MNYNKLAIHTDNSYNITHRKPFAPTIIDLEVVKTCFEFAYNMSFGKKGEHRDHRTGGTHARRNGEIFINTFQGKLAEYCVWHMFKSFSVNTDEPSLDAWELGIWDDSDLVINNYKINIKSAASFSNLLLLETKDWDANGFYKPNNQTYDFFIFVRIDPDGKSIMRRNRWFFSDNIPKADLYNEIINQNWKYDIPGFISQIQLVKIINDEHIIPKDTSLNGSTRMDASNYYCQAGDMDNIINIIEYIKQVKI